MHSPNSQCNRILEHMKINGGITSLEAFEQYGVHAWQAVYAI